MIDNRSLFLQNLAQTSDNPLGIEVEHAEGNYIYTTAGKKLLDLISGISVSSVGHLHPHVVNAIQHQLTKHMHLQVYGEYIQAPQVQMATKLLSKLPESFGSVYLVNSGSEAIEGALKLAKRYTCRYDICAFKNAYHGSSHGALSVMGDEYFKEPFRPLLPGIKHLRFNEFDDLKKITCRTAAVLIEPIQGEAGYIPADPLFLKALRERCDETQTLLIFDEIQCGMGRTGHWFAMLKYDTTPDIVCLAKGLGGGMPIGAFISRKEIMDSLKDNPILGHITTFGGHPVSCVASRAAIEVLENENLVEQVAEKEALFRKLLVHPRIKAVNGTGLMLALKLGSFEEVEKTMYKCLDKGLITDWFLFNSSCIRISPPLTISKEDIEFACRTILASLE
jgi:acetylornithine/succinyldiaminopimelate/putrescine aminotransferase